MAIPMNGGAGDYFNRLGVIIAGMNEINTFAGVTELTRANNIQQQFINTSRPVIDTLYSNYYGWLASAQGSGNSWEQFTASQLPGFTIVSMAQISNPLTTTNVTVPAALQILITQMINKAGGGTLAVPTYSILNNVVTVTVTNYTFPSNTGDGVFLSSIAAADGGTLQNSFAETMTATVTADSYSGGGTVRQEGITVLGVVGPTDTLAWNYALSGYGSNANLPINAIDPTQDAGAQSFGNVLTNSDFQAFGGAPVSNANLATGWSVSVGTPGTDILKETSSGYNSDLAPNSQGFVGQAGLPLTGIYQAIPDPQPRQVYVWSIRSYTPTAPAAGVAAIKLTNSSGTTLTNDWGTSQTSNITISGLVSATWTESHGWFQLPSILPSDGIVQFHIKLTTALTNTRVWQFSWGAMALAQQAYNATPASGVGPATNSNIAGGPYVACFAGATPFVNGDGAYLAAANDYGGKFSQGLWKTYNLPSLGLRFPTVTVSPSVPEALVT